MMLALLTYSLGGKMAASFETRSYSLPTTLYVWTYLYIYSPQAPGARLSLLYYLNDGFAPYIAFGTGYVKTHDALVHAYRGYYDTTYYYDDLISTTIPVEVTLGARFVPHRGGNSLLYVSPAFTFIWISNKIQVKDSTVYVYRDTTWTDVSDTTYRFNGTILSLPLSFGGEYFITDNASLGVEYGFNLVRFYRGTFAPERGSDTSSTSGLEFLTPDGRFRLKATFYF